MEEQMIIDASGEELLNNSVEVEETEENGEDFDVAKVIAAGVAGIGICVAGVITYIKVLKPLIAKHKKNRKKTVVIETDDYKEVDDAQESEEETED